MRLTEKTIRAIPGSDRWSEQDRKRGYRLSWDDELKGFGLRTTSAGANSFVYNYRTTDGRQRRATVGRWPGMTATAARAAAVKLRSSVDGGGDPLAAIQGRRGELSFARLVDEFAERHLSKLPSGSETERMLRRDAVPMLGKMKASDVRKRDVIALFDQKAATAPVGANRLLTSISRVYNWALKRDLIETGNPAALVAKAPERSRDRVLSEGELVTVWQRLDDAPRLGLQTADALRMILLTLARPGEVAGMLWDEIEEDWWQIPSERVKNRHTHRVPLNKLAREILAKTTQESEYVFNAPQGGQLPRMRLSDALSKSREYFGVPEFKPHDLRRTAASHIAALGTPRFIVERLLNHADRSVTGIYDRYEYGKEKQAALDAWDRKLRALLFGERAEVVELSR